MKPLNLYEHFLSYLFKEHKMHPNLSNRLLIENNDFLSESKTFYKSFAASQESQGHLLTSQNCKTPANVIAVFLRFSYLFCFTPFKVERDKNGNYQLCKWLPQQILCFLVTISSFGFRATELRTAWTQPTWNPTSFFKVFYVCSNTAFNAVVWWTVWFASDRILSLVRWSRRDYTCVNEGWEKTVHYTIILVATMSIIHALTASCIFVFGLGVFPKSRWDPLALYYCLSLKLKQAVLFQSESTCAGKSRDFYEMNVIDYICGVTGCFIVYFRRINGMYEELLICVGATAFWLHGKYFISHIKEATLHEKWPFVYKEYVKLRKYGVLTNHAFGPLLLVYTITSLFYYSINLDKFLTSNEVLVRIKYGVYYMTLLTTFILAAETNKQISYYMEAWICRNMNEAFVSQSMLIQNQLALVFHEISTQRIGMNGCDLFTITYSTAAQMAGVLITYFIICVQFGKAGA